ncbi:molecular chaperone TorD family protein [Eggerthella sp. NSJ-70]|uniref:Molecular chaperone TorD family protein n=1 Tax=Eggerthella hominis TaxID=2763043 RepID=A0ABR7BW79_9ACTN|nr:molecular chaperone TorD family protein [Eggerthella hominis]MBC5585851.1 molecular chaperone TorD family protein [Eggerthella hominis]
MAKEIPWKTLSEAYAFIGNSLLKPMTMTSTVGLDPAFWASFPTFDDAAVAEAVAACARYAEEAARRAEAGEDEPQRVAVEYTKLFVGPPSPAAAPWETMYRGQDVTVGFGQATFEMRELLRATGLEVRNENNQYEDHMGIELLYLSSQCARVDAGAEDTPAPDAVADFIEAHPLSWAEAFRVRIAETAAHGYFAPLVGLAQALLVWHVQALR